MPKVKTKKAAAKRFKAIFLQRRQQREREI